MTLRRVLIIFVVLLLFTSIISASASDDDEAKKPPPLTAKQRESLVDPTVYGTLPKQEVIRARVGQIVELTVSADSFDSATVEGVGETAAVSPGAPATFSFVPDRPGVFPVSLVSDGDRLGRVIVTATGTPAAKAEPITPPDPKVSGGASPSVK